MEEILKPAAWGWGPAGAVGWLRRIAGKREAVEAALQVEGRVGLGPKKQLVLVNCRGRRVLLALSGEAITPVMEMDAEPRPRRRAKGAGR